MIWICEGKVRRRGEKVSCKQCNSEFIRGLNKKTEHCSRQCSGKSRRERISLSCSVCKKDFERKPSAVLKAKHGYSFCSRKCKEFAQSLEANFKELRPDFYKDGARIDYRLKCSDLIKQGCVSCGESKIYKLAIHHKDGDRTNNMFPNLEVACHNCHVVRHLRKTDTGWIYDPHELTPRHMIKQLS